LWKVEGQILLIAREYAHFAGKRQLLALKAAETAVETLRYPGDVRGRWVSLGHPIQDSHFFPEIGIRFHYLREEFRQP
jgi:hypothetical protein